MKYDPVRAHLTAIGIFLAFGLFCLFMFFYPIAAWASLLIPIFGFMYYEIARDHTNEPMD